MDESTHKHYKTNGQFEEMHEMSYLVHCVTHLKHSQGVNLLWFKLKGQSLTMTKRS